MYFLVIHFSILEAAVLLIGAVILGLTIHFFIASRRSLKETIEQTNRKVTLRPQFYNPAPPVEKAPKPVDPFAEERKEVKRSMEAELPRPEPTRQKALPKEETIDSLKETVVQQQKLLNSFLRQVEEIENEGREDLEMQNKHLQEEINDLQAKLEDKDGELEEVRQQAAMSERMAARIEEVYQEFELLQTKMAALEKQANKANNLALELEDTRQAYEQIHKDLQRKNEKLEETFMENQRLQHQVNTLEDKLAEANLQRQQYQKKVQFLQDLNTDLQTVSDTNKKLQTELRRIGELESMLNMISEERDYLLRRQINK